MPLHKKILFVDCFLRGSSINFVLQSEGRCLGLILGHKGLVHDGLIQGERVTHFWKIRALVVTLNENHWIIHLFITVCSELVVFSCT